MTRGGIGAAMREKLLTAGGGGGVGGGDGRPGGGGGVGLGGRSGSLPRRFEAGAAMSAEWHDFARDRLADIWVTATPAEREVIERAVHEINARLAADPSFLG